MTRFNLQVELDIEITSQLDKKDDPHIQYYVKVDGEDFCSIYGSDLTCYIDPPVLGPVLYKILEYIGTEIGTTYTREDYGDRIQVFGDHYT